MQTCPLCQTHNEIILYQNRLIRVIQAHDESDYPALCRIILNQHLAEMTDLPIKEREEVMLWVYQTETAIRQLLQPTKINLACLGNMVPHLHWHIIPRFEDDSHFPASIWAVAKRQGQRHGTGTQFTEKMRKLLNT